MFSKVPKITLCSNNFFVTRKILCSYIFECSTQTLRMMCAMRTAIVLFFYKLFWFFSWRVYITCVLLDSKKTLASLKPRVCPNPEFYRAMSTCVCVLSFTKILSLQNGVQIKIETFLYTDAKSLLLTELSFFVHYFRPLLFAAVLILGARLMTFGISKMALYGSS